MTDLPIPARQFFKDFSFDLDSFLVKRTGITLDGLTNKDEEGHHVAFLYGCDIQVGDVIVSGSKHYVVNRIEVDGFNGQPDMAKAYY